MTMETVPLGRREFDELPEYSCSLPTGTTIGKRWKRCEPYQASREFGAPDATWYLGEYVEYVGDETKVGIRWSLIHVETPRETQVRKRLELDAYADRERDAAMESLGEKAQRATSAVQGFGELLKGPP